MCRMLRILEHEIGYMVYLKKYKNLVNWTQIALYEVRNRKKMCMLLVVIDIISVAPYVT